MRRQKAHDLKIHGAYAWVKGNHIDHHVAEACEGHGVKSTVAKAGMTWQYLQFANQDEQTLFIVKNARYFNADEVNKGMDAKGKPRSRRSSYMDNLMAINRNVDFGSVQGLETAEQSIQLELLQDFQPLSLLPEDTAGMDKQFDRFYIATYHIDDDHLISEIRIWMPNPENNKAYLISDLTAYIGNKPGHLFGVEEELRAVLDQTIAAEGILDAGAFGIVIDDSEEKKS